MCEIANKVKGFTFDELLACWTAQFQSFDLLNFNRITFFRMMFQLTLK